ncbi:hypothetical protein ADILRU_2191 [Leifsonia rubra CMS 76R]|nr:hypothetical protein ADILRU_2191 [Leifsonia rubra CMS 76R]
MPGGTSIGAIPAFMARIGSKFGWRVTITLTISVNTSEPGHFP